MTLEELIKNYYASTLNETIEGAEQYEASKNLIGFYKVIVDAKSKSKK